MQSKHTCIEISYCITVVCCGWKPSTVLQFQSWLTEGSNKKQVYCICFILSVVVSSCCGLFFPSSCSFSKIKKEQINHLCDFGTLAFMLLGVSEDRISMTSSRDGPIRVTKANGRWWRNYSFFCRPLVDHHFGSQNTQQTAAHTSTLLRGLTMVHTCVVAGCRNRRTPGTTLSFYRFPRDPERKQRWIAAVNREGWVPNDGSRLCSTHFISGMKAKPLWTLKVSPCVGFLFVCL